MAIQTSNLGPNSCYVIYTSGETIANVCGSVWAWVQSHGWELHDDAATASSKAFKSLCYDATTYKYITIGYDANGIVLRVFEGWNASTHVGTNETYYGTTATARSQRVDVSSGGYVYLFAAPRYCIVYGKTLSGMDGAATINSWAACFEFTEDGRDNRGLPPYGYASGYGLLGGHTIETWGAQSTTLANARSSWLSVGQRYNGFSLPRNAGSQTGANAESFTNVGCSLGMSSLLTTTVSVAPNPPNNGYPDYIGSYIFTFGGNPDVISTGGGNMFCNVYGSFKTTAITTGGSAVGGALHRLTYTTVNTASRLADILPTTNNTFTSTPWALTPWIYEMGQTTTTIQTVNETRGKIYGIKLLQTGLGNFLDTITINCDDRGFMLVDGTETTHHVLTGGALGTSRFAIPA